MVADITDGGAAVPVGAPAAAPADNPADASAEQIAELVDALFGVVHDARSLVRHDPGPLPPPLTWLLALLDEHGGLRIGELATRSGTAAPTVSRHVATAGELGLLTRTPDSQDGRACLLGLSPTGAQALARYRATRLAHARRLVGDWDPDDIATLTTLLRRLRRAAATT